MLTLSISQNYLLIPVKLGAEKQLLTVFSAQDKEKKLYEFEVPFPRGGEAPDWFAAIPMRRHRGETLLLRPYRAASGCRVQVQPERQFSALAEGPRLARAGFAALRVLGNREDFRRLCRALDGEAVQEDGQTMVGHLYQGVE